MTDGVVKRPVLLVKSGAEELVPKWQEAFAELNAELDVRSWTDSSVKPEDVKYVLVWDPEPGRLHTLPNLKVIFSSAAGVDNVLRDPQWPKHLPLVRMGSPGTAQRMGEFIVWSCLSLLRGARRMSIAQTEQRWDFFECPKTAQETRVGIMGLGNLGSKAAAMLQPVGFQVSGWSRNRKELPGVKSFAGAEEMSAFLAQTDILVCLLPSTAETVGIINKDMLAQLPHGAGLVNAGRGSHTVMEDVIAALDSGQLSGAVLDVFTQEPLPSSDPIWKHPKAIVTSHVASVASRRERTRYVLDAIASFEAGGPLPNLFDLDRGY